MHNSFYINNRKKLISKLEDEVCLILLSSGYTICKSYDEDYDFKVNNNFYYLAGIIQPMVHLLLIKDKDSYQECLFIDEYDEMYEKWVGHRLTRKEASDISGIAESNIKYIKDFDNTLNELFKKYQTIYLDLEKNRNFNHHSFGLFMENKLQNEKVNIIDIYEHVIEIRASKTDEEIEKIKQAIEITRIGIENLMKHSKPGMYEYQLESYFDQTIKINGNRKHAFPTIAASGVNATTLHYSSNDSIMKDGDLITFDLGCQVDEYNSDITRTFPINGKFSKLQKTIYNIVLDTNKLIEKKAHAGMTLRDLQEIAVKSLTDGCLKAKLIKKPDEIKNYYYHGVSHLIGLDTHDPITRNITLPENSVISNEPGLYIKELNIGIRIEDDLLLLKDRAINLSKDIIKEVSDIEKLMQNQEDKYE